MGKQRPKSTSINGYIRTYTPKETVNYESMVVSAYKEQYQDPIFGVGDEIHATIVAYFKIPKSHYHYHKRTQTTDLDKEGELMKSGIIRPRKTPDCDNIAKICLDALNGIAYPDDAQVTCLLVMKYYAESPLVEITLEKIEKEYIERNNNE